MQINRNLFYICKKFEKDLKYCCQRYSNKHESTAIGNMQKSIGKSRRLIGIMQK